MSLKYIVVIWFWFVGIVLYGQISRGGAPLPLQKAELTALSEIIEKMPQLPAYVQQYDKFQEHVEKGQPLRFAHSHNVSFTPDNSGVHTKQPDGSSVWRLMIHSEGAFSLNLIFDKFLLAPDCSLFIYNEDQSYVLGAFTHENNLPSGRLATAPVPGDQLIVELHQPSGMRKGTILEIGSVNHDYLDLLSLKSISRFGRSGNCNPDFTCETEELWHETGQAVSRIMINGRDLCSGTLINNTREDGKPYYLTAAHCILEDDSPETVVFTFNYQVPNCDGRVEGAFTQTLSGSILRAYAETLDVALLEMSEIPPADYRPYWAGWDRSISAQGEVLTIHHPEGDVKKVARSENPPTSSTFNASSPGGERFLADSHWRIARWSEGTTEPGSSGAPLFTSQGRVIGSLSGGSATCANPVNDYFTRFNKFWNYFDEENMQLAYWLDPNGSGVDQLNGINFYQSQDEVSRLSNFLFDDVADINSYNSGNGFWSGHNSKEDKAFAEQYGPFSAITLHGIYLMPGRSDFLQNQRLNISVWQGTNEPQTQIKIRNNVHLFHTKSNREYFWEFTEPLNTSGNIWIGVELTYEAEIDSFALFHSTYSSSRNVSSAWVKDVNDQWHKLSERETDVYPLSFWIDILASNIQELDTSVVIPEKSDFLIFPNPVINEVNFVIPDFTGLAQIELYNQSGQMVTSHEVPVLNQIGALTNLNIGAGLYIYRLRAGNKVYNGKLFVRTD